MLMSDDLENFFPPKPEEPREEDCCGTGCSPCVFDIYRKRLSEWEKTCSTLMENKEEMTTNYLDHSKVLCTLKFSPFQLISVRLLTANTNIYRFQAVEVSEEKVSIITKRLEFSPGQHLVMRGNSTDDKSVVTRAYTPISDSKIDMPGCFDVLIKLYSDGKMSNIVRNLNLSDIVYWRGPYGDFEYKCNKYRLVVMLCAGTGVAPMYPIAKTIVEDENEETFVRLLFSCRKQSEILLREEIRELAGYWNFTARIFLTQDVASGSGYREYFTCGRINKMAVLEELSGKPLQNALVLICGTKVFNKDMLNYVQQVGVPSVNVHVF